MNNCRRCGTEGVASKALVNGYRVANDFYGDEDNTDITGRTCYPNPHDVKLKDCIKCPKCGHSWTPDKSELTREVNDNKK